MPARRCSDAAWPPPTVRCVAGPKHDAALSDLSADRWPAQRALGRPWRSGGLRTLFPWPPTDLVHLAALSPAAAEALARTGLTPRPALGEMSRAAIRGMWGGVVPGPEVWGALAAAAALLAA